MSLLPLTKLTDYPSAMKISQLIVSLAASILFACSTTESNEPQQESNTTPDSVYSIDTLKSVVTWIGSLVGKKHNGTIDFESGNLHVKNDTVIGGEFTIHIPSLKIRDLTPTDPNQATLKASLFSPEFLDIDTFPTVKVEFLQIEALIPNQDSSTLYIPTYDNILEAQTDNPNYKLTVRMTIKDQTQNLSFPTRVEWSTNRMITESRFTIDLGLWGLNYPSESDVENATNEQIVQVGYYIEAASVSQ